MAFLIGTDEAGYGPNLGPLVISASVWEVADRPADVDLYQQLAAVICRAPSKAAGRRARVAVADSKQLYKPAQGLSQLERGVLAAVGLLEDCPDSWRTLWNLLEPRPAAPCDSLPWHDGFALDLPTAADRSELGELIPWFRRGIERAGVRLAALRSRTVFPEQFNDLTELYGSKGEALSRLTLELVANLLAEFPPADTLVVCDKHGGRSRYAGLLQHLFPDALVEVLDERAAESAYRWGPLNSRIEFRFRAGGEDALPTALASMTSKYLRELTMRAFNDFWRRHVPELRPTAGYPLDAVRFKADIAAAQTQLGIADRILWRVR